jgi:WD40 repeat protein
MVVYVDWKRYVNGLDLKNGKRLKSFPTADTNALRNWSAWMTISLSSDSSLLATSSLSALGVDIWDWKREKLLYSLPEEPGMVYSLAWHPDSKRLAVARESGALAIWDLREIELILASIGLGASDSSSPNGPHSTAAHSK